MNRAGSEDRNLVTDRPDTRIWIVTIDMVRPHHDQVRGFVVGHASDFGAALAVRDNRFDLKAFLGHIGGPGAHFFLGLGPKFLVKLVHLTGLVILKGFDDVEQKNKGLIGGAELLGPPENVLICAGQIDRDQNYVVHHGNGRDNGGNVHYGDCQHRR